MKVENNFIYRLTDRLGTLAVIPLGEKGFSLDYERQNEDKLSYEKKLSGKIMFVGEAFQRLNQMENSVYRCDEQTLTILKVCNGIEKVIFVGKISLNEAEFNLDKCQIVAKFLEDKTDKCIDDGKNAKLNLLNLIYQKREVKLTTAGSTIETKICHHQQYVNPTDMFELQTWCGTGDPYLQNWNVVENTVNMDGSIGISPDPNSPPQGGTLSVTTKWVREIIEINCSEAPEPEWVLIEDNCSTTGKMKYANNVSLYDCGYSYLYFTDEWNYSNQYTCKYLGGTSNNSGTTKIDNGILLNDALEELIRNSCPNLTVKSEFFQINEIGYLKNLLSNSSMTSNGDGYLAWFYNTLGGAINGITIYQNGTFRLDITSGSGSQWSLGIAVQIFPSVLDFSNIKNGTFTMSYEVKTNTLRTINPAIYSYQGYSILSQTTVVSNNSEWKRISITFKTNDVNYSDLYFYAFSPDNWNTGDFMQIRKLKLEIGNQASNYSTSEQVLNYVTGKNSNVNNIVIFQKSDVKRPTASGNASKLEIDLETMLEVLKIMFNVKWRIEGNIFRLEHVSYYSKAVGTNVMSNELKKYFEGKRIYSYQSEKIPQKETFKFKEQGYNPDYKMKITYSGCVTNTKKNEVNFLIDEATTDVQLCLNNPSSDSKIVEDAGFVLISTKKIGNEYFVNSETSPNGRAINNVFAWVQLIRDFHYYERPMKSGIVNGIKTNFISSIPTKKGDKFAIPLNVCQTDFNPDDFVLTALGQGIVSSAKYRFNDSFLELDLLYEANQDLVPNAPPTLSGGGSFFTYKEVTKVIDVVASDTDGTISSLVVNTPPYNGTIQFNSLSQFTYTPNVGFVGNDYFSIKALDNFSEVSNVENFSIEVKPPNQSPVAQNDTFTVYQGENFYQGTSLFANDSDDNSFTLVNSNVVSSQGVAITINANGFFSYVPPVGFEGTDTFQYSIKDDAGLTSTATVTLNVMDKNKPIAVEDNYQTKINTAFSTDGTLGKEKLTANDYTPNGQTYNYTTTPETKATANGGTVQIFADGNFTYTPPNGFTGIDQFNYTVQNPNGSKVGIAKISVVPIIYVELFKDDFQSDPIIIFCGQPPQQELGGTRQREDIKLRFWADAQKTIPFDTTGLNFKVKIKETTTWQDGNNPPINWDTNFLTDFTSGTNHLVYDDYFTYEQEYGCGGFGNMVYERNVQFSLIAGAYNII